MWVCNVKKAQGAMRINKSTAVRLICKTSDNAQVQEKLAPGATRFSVIPPFAHLHALRGCNRVL